MKYTIQITYDTGDSFSNEYGKVDTVGAVWDDKEEAIKALDYIQEHYKSLGRRGSWRGEEYKEQPWYDKECFQVCLRVPIGGKMKRISAFWCGYFETLRCAKVVPYTEELESDSRTERYF